MPGAGQLRLPAAQPQPQQSLPVTSGGSMAATGAGHPASYAPSRPTVAAGPTMHPSAAIGSRVGGMPRYTNGVLA